MTEPVPSTWDQVADILTGQGLYPHNGSAEKSYEEGKWAEVIMFSVCVPEPGRKHEYWDYFDLLKQFMSDSEYALAVREIWVYYNGLPPERARQILVDHGRNISRNMWMLPVDIKKFESLDDPCSVFRGCLEAEIDGWCWSLDREIAIDFALEEIQPGTDGTGFLISGTVKKEHVIALFCGETEREQEIVVPGNLVEEVTIESVSLP